MSILDTIPHDQIFPPATPFVISHPSAQNVLAMTSDGTWLQRSHWPEAPPPECAGIYLRADYDRFCLVWIPGMAWHDGTDFNGAAVGVIDQAYGALSNALLTYMRAYVELRDLVSDQGLLQ